MSLFIQTDAGGAGSGGGIHPDSAQAHMIQISNNDLNLGFDPPSMPPDLMQVTYGAQQSAGPCPTRLHDLVNTQFNVNPQHIDIIVIGVDDSFMLNDGSLITSAAGITAPVGSTNNPTASVLVIYDTSQAGGTGYCVREQGHSDRSLEFPGAAILYHELSHAFRFATSATLSQSASGCAASPEENAAEIDENDMRTQLGVALRDATDHCGSAGCPSSCCVVASIATGSAYSSQVNSLRSLRDRFLRSSEIGHRFFDDFFREYYGFSPAVCRLMGQKRDVRQLIECYFVEPLTVSLQMIQDYTLDRQDPAVMGACFLEAIDAAPALRDLSSEQLAYARNILASLRAGVRPSEPELVELADLMMERGAGSAEVRWALVDPVDIFVQGLEWRLDGRSASDIGSLLAFEIDNWSSEMPISGIWSTLGRYDLKQELAFLQRSLLRSAHARSRFASRLSRTFPEDGRLQEALTQAGYRLDTEG